MHFGPKKHKYHQFKVVLKLKLKAEMQKGVYFAKIGRLIRGKNEKGLFKCFKHIKYAGNYNNYKNIKYSTISTNLISTVYPLVSAGIQTSATL